MNIIQPAGMAMVMDLTSEKGEDIDVALTIQTVASSIGTLAASAFGFIGICAHPFFRLFLN